MSNELCIVNENSLTLEERQEIDMQIESIISRHQNNRYEINRLVFESVAALTESENYSNELSSKRGIKRFVGSITGSNKKLQSQINSSLARSQYASQQTLQKLAEQNLMSFELISAVNNKLNASVVNIENEINNIYGTLVTFFKKAKSDIIQLENRVERLERNVNLLNWQNSIEYQVWNDVEYSELDDVSKIVCLTRDFYDITKGNWTTSDLLLLKTAMATIGMNPKDMISYQKFILTVSNNYQLIEKLFSGMELKEVENYSEQVAISAGIHKSFLLENEERFIIDGTRDLLIKNGCEVSDDVIKKDMIISYSEKCSYFNLRNEVETYDFILEILYNLQQLREIEKIGDLDHKLKTAEHLFGLWKIKEVIPLLNELADYGISEAKYMMALIYETGYLDEMLEEGDGLDDIILKLPNVINKKNKLLDECISEGYIPAFVRKILPLWESSDVSQVVTLKRIIEQLKTMAENGDIFASYEYSRVLINLRFLGLNNEDDYEEAIKFCDYMPYVLKKHFLACRYYSGTGYDKDYDKSFELFKDAANLGYAPAKGMLGDIYNYGYGVEKDEAEAAEWYVNAICFPPVLSPLGRLLLDDDEDGAEELGFAIFKAGAEVGLTDLNDLLGCCYEYGRGTDVDFTKAIECYKKTNSDYANRQIGNIYLEGKGVEKNTELAKKYLEKAAKMGDNQAKYLLREKFNIEI